MNHAAKLAGDVGMSRDERSMLLGGNDDGESAGTTNQVLSVLGQMRDISEAVVDGRAGALWIDECMNQLIVGVELSLAQGWNEVVDAFGDAGRILQSYESGGRAEDATLFLIDAYGLLCALVSDSMNAAPRPENADKWQARYREEVGTLQAAGLELVSDDYDGVEDERDSPFESPENTAKNIVRLRPQDDLPSLDQLPPLDSVVSAAAQSAQPKAQPAPAAEGRPRVQHVAKSPIEVAHEAQRAAGQAQTAAESAMDEAEIAAASGKGAKPSQSVVEIVDRICEELAGLSRHSADDRILSLEMIQGGVAALKREAAREDHRPSIDLCEEMMKACLFATQENGQIDERFTDLAFGFCGVYVEAMNNPGSENVAEWRAECSTLIDEWAQSAAEDDEIRKSRKFRRQAAAQDSSPQPPEQPKPPAQPPRAAATPAPTRQPAPAPAPPPPAAAAAAPSLDAAAAGRQSFDLFARAQEALARGDGEAAKALALQAAAMIAEAEVDKAEARLRDAEARLKANVSATEESRSEVKHTEKLVMNSASDAAAGETQLGQAKSHTAKMTHELQEAETEVAEIDRQIAELMARREEQVRDTEGRKSRLTEAKSQESDTEAQLEALRDAEKESRKTLEAARQRVKDHQRITSEIESDMERAREMLSRQRSSLADIQQTINRPDPIKTGEPGDEDSLLF